MLSALHPAPNESALIEITGLAQHAIPSKRYFTDIALAAEHALDLNAVGYNVFHSVNCRNSFRALEVNVPFSGALYLDFDEKHGGEEAARQATRRLADNGIAVSVSVASGHGAHLYLLLRPADTMTAKLAAGRLCKITNSDHVHNQNRIARLPGSLNWKEPAAWCRITGWEPDRRYDLAEVDAALDRMGAPRASQPRDVEPRVSTGSITMESPDWWMTMKLRLSQQALIIIESGERNVMSTGQVSRSEADWLVVCALVNADATDEQIAWVYENWPIGDMKYRSSGRHYLAQTIQKARYHLAEPVRQARSRGKYIGRLARGSTSERLRMEVR